MHEYKQEYPFLCILVICKPMANPHYRSQFGDTTFTKVFVGGLAWETPTEEMRKYFEQFGEILEAVIINDKNTGKSKGYGFVTFRDPESARRACADPNPVIDGRRANCNIASLGRPRPSPPRGRPQGGNTNPYQGSQPYSGGATPLQPTPPPPLPPPPPPPPVIYPHYGYPTYTPDYGYHQAIYNTQVQQPQYYHQMYRPTSSSTMGSPYYYHGYPLQPLRSALSGPQAQHLQAAAGPSYLYYPTEPYTPPNVQSTRHHPFVPSSSSTDLPHTPTTETEAGVVTSESINP